jgi:hypothetical protein
MCDAPPDRPPAPFPNRAAEIRASLLRLLRLITSEIVKGIEAADVPPGPETTPPRDRESPRR